MPLSKKCNISCSDLTDGSLELWKNLLNEVIESADNINIPYIIEDQIRQSLEQVMNDARQVLSDSGQKSSIIQSALADQTIQQMEELARKNNNASHMGKYLFSSPMGRIWIEQFWDITIKSIALAPATKSVLENLDWFQENFEQVYVGDNFKVGEIHFGQEIISVDELLKKASDVDAFFLTTDTPEIEKIYADILPHDTLFISDLIQSNTIEKQSYICWGLARAKRILSEIEKSDNPLVFLGRKMLATVEPTFTALDNIGFDVFSITQTDKFENASHSGYNNSCPISRNVILSFYEQIYILTHLKKGKLWIYYDFFFNVGWNVTNSIATYGFAAAVLKMASRPVILGMYDIIKPVCLNMERQHEAFALYKTMLSYADAVVLTSSSEHIAEYLRNTLLKDRPVMSFYRYTFPPQHPKVRLSDSDGERHLVAVTSFLGEVYEPNRVATRDSIRSILKQKIHFHYYSDNKKVFDFQDELTTEEKIYFHIEPAIWDQNLLIQALSQYDGGWLVGDESSIFAKFIAQIEDRTIRELFNLFVPNGIPTSSMVYGAAGLVVFVSRQIKVMDDVFPKNCYVPLDMGEVDNLSAIFSRLDWSQLHKTLRNECYRFNIYDQIGRLDNFLKQLPNKRISTISD